MIPSVVVGLDGQGLSRWPYMFCWLHCWLYIVIFRLLFVHLCKHPQYEVYDFHFGLQNLAKWLLLKEELKQIRQHYRDEIDRQHDLLQKTQIEAREAQENFLSDLLKVPH